MEEVSARGPPAPVAGSGPAAGPMLLNVTGPTRIFICASLGRRRAFPGPSASPRPPRALHRMPTSSFMALQVCQPTRCVPEPPRGDGDLPLKGGNCKGRGRSAPPLRRPGPGGPWLRRRRARRSLTFMSQ
eukprot:12756996-Alexandrium_andersonii.AAC.1